MKRHVALGLCGGLTCAVPAAAAPTRHYDYALEYALATSDYLAVQRRHREFCERMKAHRCRVTLSRTSEGDAGPATLTLQVLPSAAPKVLQSFAGSVDEAGGDIRHHEFGMIERAGTTQPDGNASIALTYVGLPGFAEQTGKALRAFGPSLVAGLAGMVFLLPLLGPWIAVNALIVWGLRTIWRRRRRARE